MARAALVVAAVLAGCSVLAIAASADYVASPTCVLDPADDVQARIGATVTVTVRCTSGGGPGPWTASIAEPPAIGSATIAPTSPGTFVASYTAPASLPASRRSDYASVSIQVNDGASAPTYTGFGVTITLPPQPPRCDEPSQEYAVAEVEQSFAANCFTEDGPYPTIELVSRPGHGSLTEQDSGLWLYRAAKGYAGADSFSYRARNDAGTSPTVIQRITVLKPRPGQLPTRGRRSPVEACLPIKAGEQCGAGLGRRTRGGGEKVSHRHWPRVTGILWSVRDSGDHAKTGGPLNDELLGHHGSDRISGAAGIDIIWGDWDPDANNETQRDVLTGGRGGDFIYTSHGANTVRAGAGNDHVWAFYGHGTIDCGSGRDIVRDQGGKPCLPAAPLRAAREVLVLLQPGLRDLAGVVDPDHPEHRVGAVLEPVRRLRRHVDDVALGDDHLLVAHGERPLALDDEERLCVRMHVQPRSHARRGVGEEERDLRAALAALVEERGRSEGEVGQRDRLGHRMLLSQAVTGTAQRSGRLGSLSARRTNQNDTAPTTSGSQKRITR